MIDILTTFGRDIQQLKSSADGNAGQTELQSVQFFTETISGTDTFTGKSRGLGSVFILDHPTWGKLGVQTPQPYLGGANGSPYASGAYIQV